MTNQILENIGKTQTQNLIDDITNEYKEIFLKKYPNYFESNYAKAVSLVTVLENQEIKSIGISKQNDLLSDNFGEFLGGIMTKTDFTQVETTTAIRAISYTLFNDTDVNLPQTKGSSIQIGKGVTPATRQDFNIESAFATAPESVRKATSNGGWNSGLGRVDFSSVIIAGGAGAISETAWFMSMIFTTFGITALWSRDNISPVANFIIGQTINVNYNVFLS